MKKLFRYISLKLQGCSNASLSIPGKSRISLCTGHRVELNAQPSDWSKVRLSVKWSDLRRMLLNTTFNQDKGKPLILGGPSAPSQNGNLILILLPKYSSRLPELNRFGDMSERMAYRNCRCIGFIVSHSASVSNQSHNRTRNLVFAGPPNADDRLLHSERGVFKNRLS